MTRRPMAPPLNGPRFNEFISVPKVRVIDENGENLGVLLTAEAIEQAAQVGLDLVEVSPNADPPVCKFLDVGKFKYEAQKKANLARLNDILGQLGSQAVSGDDLARGSDDHLVAGQGLQRPGGQGVGDDDAGHGRRVRPAWARAGVVPRPSAGPARGCAQGRHPRRAA